MYKELCQKITKENENLNSVSKIALDVICNFESLKTEDIQDLKFQRKKIDIVNGRHPVVEESLKKDGEDFTPNDCLMTSENNIWIMTGPNMVR